VKQSYQAIVFHSSAIHSKNHSYGFSMPKPDEIQWNDATRL